MKLPTRRRSPLMRGTKWRARVLCSAALAQMLLPAPLLWAQPSSPGLIELLRSRNVATQISASDLTTDWARVTVEMKAEHKILNLIIRGADGGATTDVAGYFYTRGETLEIGGENYLIAYRLVDANAMPRGAARRDSPDATEAQKQELDEKLPVNSRLALSLLNLRTTGDLNDIRAFDPARDVLSLTDLKKLEISRADEQSVLNLKQIGLGLMQYTQDNDEGLPPMRTVQSKAEILAPANLALPTVQNVLQPYVKSVEIFAHPITRQIYRPNFGLSHRALSELDYSSVIVTFYEASPNPNNGTRAVLYLDGHVRREDEADWPRIWRQSQVLAGLLVIAQARPDPMLITPLVKTRLSANAMLKGSNINVDTTENTVTLSGTVRSSQQQWIAVTTARKYAPGYKIIDRLKVIARR